MHLLAYTWINSYLLNVNIELLDWSPGTWVSWQCQNCAWLSWPCPGFLLSTQSELFVLVLYVLHVIGQD